jgi:hypothetical protein
MTHHHDLVLVPTSPAEERLLDLLTGGSSAEATVVHAEVRTDDAYNNYVLLQPPGAPQPAPAEPRAPRYDPDHGGD